MNVRVVLCGMALSPFPVSMCKTCDLVTAVKVSRLPGVFQYVEVVAPIENTPSLTTVESFLSLTYLKILYRSDWQASSGGHPVAGPLLRAVFRQLSQNSGRIHIEHIGLDPCENAGQRTLKRTLLEDNTWILLEENTWILHIFDLPSHQLHRGAVHNCWVATKKGRTIRAKLALMISHLLVLDVIL